MNAPNFLTGPKGRRIAYHFTPGQGPCVVFMAGFMSDMGGTKAIYLEAWARAQGRAFLRFDYSGHGDSSGVFAEGCIGDWAADAMAAIADLTTGKVILVGSSMGGWISLLVAKAMSEKIAGLVGIAAAPDFTEDSMWAGFDAGQRQTLESQGRIELPSDYDDGPYIISKRLIEDGRDQLVLRTPLDLPFPTRFLQGTQDEDVDMSVALRLLDHASGDDIRLILVKGADHRFSSDNNLRLVRKAVHSVIMAVQS